MSIVSNGLIAHFDPDNTTSYSGSGTALTSLVGSATGTIVGSGGSFSKVTGGIRLNNSHILAGDFSTTGRNIKVSSVGVQTISIWYKHHSINEAEWYLLDGRGSGGSVPAGSWIIGNGGTGTIWSSSNGGIAYKNGISTTTNVDTELNVWKNITVIANQAFTSDINIFGRFNSTTAPDVTFGPILIYNRAITQAENATNFNVIASRYGLNTIAIPSAVNSLFLWLDAADSSTLTYSSGTSVSEWRDKSGSNRHFSQSTVANQPYIVSGAINGVNALQFQISHSLRNATLNFNINNAYTIFVVAKADSSTGYPYAYSYLLKGNAVDDNYLFMGRVNNNFATFTGSSTAWNDVNANSPPLQPMTPTIMGMTVNNNVLTPYFNGTAQTTKNGNTAAFTSMILGRSDDKHDGAWIGNIAEVIIYGGALSTNDRQTIEGYLASKWGLSTKLPAGHPYFSSASAPDKPTSVSAVAENGQAVVSWTAPVSNGGASITSYTVTSSPGSRTVTTANGTTTSARIVGLTNGTSYTFTVKATTSLGDSVSSDPSSAIIPSITGVAISPVNMGILSYASLFITNDGKLYKSGSLYYATYPGVEQVIVPGNKTVKQALTGNTNAVYLTTDGICYHVSLGLSDSNFTQITIPSPDTNVKISSISLGGSGDPGSILMVLENGNVYGFGTNTHGQLGNGTTTNVPRTTPVKMNLPAGVSAVAAVGGKYWNYIIDSTGNLWGCGLVSSTEGYPTNTATGNVTTPISCMKDSLLGKKVVGVTGLGLVHCSDNTLHTIGLANRNGYGSTLTAHTQLSLAALSGKTIKIMDASEYHNTILCTDGTVIVFGMGTAVTNLTSTILGSEAADVIVSNISIMWNFNNNINGDYDLFAILSNGKVISYGGNFNNEIGTGRSQAVARRVYGRTDIIPYVYTVSISSITSVPQTATAAVAAGSNALTTYMTTSTATSVALAKEVRAAIKALTNETAKATAKAEYIAAIRAKEPTLKIAVPQTEFSTYIATFTNVPTAIAAAPKPIDVILPSEANIVDITTASVDKTKYTAIEMPINTTMTVQDNGVTVGTLMYNGSVYTDGNSNTYNVGDTIIFGTKKVTILGQGSALVSISNSYIPIEVNLNVEISANGTLNVLGYQPTTPSNLVIASTKLPVDALYDSANGIALFEFWEPDNLDDIEAQLAETQLLGGIEGYKITAKKLALGLQNILTGELDAKAAEPFNMAPKYGAVGAQNGNRVMTGFGRFALMAYAHYIMGHVQATAAITNDTDFMKGMMSLNSDTLTDYKYANIGDYDATTAPWTISGTATDANLAVRLVRAIIDANPTSKKVSDNVVTSAANIVQQVIGQDASRATDEDNNKYSPENHGLLRFYPDDIIYVSITLTTPVVNVATGQRVSDGTLEDLYTNATGDKKYTLKITLGPASA